MFRVPERLASSEEACYGGINPLQKGFPASEKGCDVGQLSAFPQLVVKKVRKKHRKRREKHRKRQKSRRKYENVVGPGGVRYIYPPQSVLNMAMLQHHPYPSPSMSYGYYPDPSLMQYEELVGKAPAKHCSYYYPAFETPHISTSRRVETQDDSNILSEDSGDSRVKNLQPHHNVETTSSDGSRCSGLSSDSSSHFDSQNKKRKSDEISNAKESSPKLKTRKAKRKSNNASSRYKGVSWHKRDKCYMARVWVDGMSKHIGSYQEELRAALAVDYTLMSMEKDSSHMNFSSQLERDIAASILKHFAKTKKSTKKIDKSDKVNDKNEKDKNPIEQLAGVENDAVDRNGYTNSVPAVLSGLLSDMKSREKKLAEEGKKKKDKKDPEVASSKKDPGWETLLEVASTQPRLIVTRNGAEKTNKVSKN